MTVDFPLLFLYRFLSLSFVLFDEWQELSYTVEFVFTYNAQHQLWAFHRNEQIFFLRLRVNKGIVAPALWRFIRRASLVCMLKSARGAKIKSRMWITDWFSWYYGMGHLAF